VPLRRESPGHRHATCGPAESGCGGTDEFSGGSAKGKRVRFSGREHTVVDGPFAETEELIAGFWLWQVRDMDEAVAWARRCPNPMPGGGELELRPVFEADDFGAEFTPELRAQEDAQRERLRPHTANG